MLNQKQYITSLNTNFIFVPNIVDKLLKEYGIKNVFVEIEEKYFYFFKRKNEYSFVSIKENKLITFYLLYCYKLNKFKTISFSFDLENKNIKFFIHKNGKKIIVPLE